ncbi:hypothetical protein BJ742DRAFT_777448 [Cladochytrium replicatum]|nr:hypothetical protein BJ742DRAFT_777448 [Cladochytrium replicatum]
MPPRKLEIVGKVFVKVPLEEPLNWLAGKKLFPRHMMMGCHAELQEYDVDGFIAFMAEKVRSLSGCTSFIVSQGNNSGDTGGRYWFGNAFGGGPTDQSWYEREERLQVSHSVAYSVEK